MGVQTYLVEVPCREAYQYTKYKKSFTPSVRYCTRNLIRELILTAQFRYPGMKSTRTTSRLKLWMPVELENSFTHSVQTGEQQSSPSSTTWGTVLPVQHQPAGHHLSVLLPTHKPKGGNRGLSVWIWYFRKTIHCTLIQLKHPLIKKFLLAQWFKKKKKKGLRSTRITFNTHHPQADRCLLRWEVNFLPQTKHFCSSLPLHGCLSSNKR